MQENTSNMHPIFAEITNSFFSAMTTATSQNKTENNNTEQKMEDTKNVKH